MGKLFDLSMCFVFSLIFGFCWGGVVYWFDPLLGITMGLFLFLLCMLVLINSLDQFKEPEVKHNRRFNDI